MLTGILWLMACAPPPVEVRAQSLQTVSEDGATLIVEVTDETHLLFDLSADAWLAVDRLVGPEGSVLEWTDWTAGEQLTLGVFSRQGNTVLNWPIRAVDPPLTPGIWTLEVSVTDAEDVPLSGVTVDGTLVAKLDSNPQRGRLKAVILVPRALDEQLRAGLDVAIDLWVRRFSIVGIQIEVERMDADLSVQVPFPYGGDPAITAAVALAGDAQLVIWAGEELLGEAAIGNAGGIPGSSRPNPYGVVGLAVGLAAGPDGVFQRGEEQALGDALSHEVGHFLGLFHPVELSFNEWDALEDTVACRTRTECERALGDNIMFPYAACDSCVPGWTADQRAVLNAYVGVR